MTGNDLNQLTDKVDSLIKSFEGFKSELQEVRSDVQEVRSDVQEVRSDVQEVKTRLGALEGDVKEVRTSLGNLDSDVTDLKDRKKYIADASSWGRSVSGGDMDRLPTGGSFHEPQSEWKRRGALDQD